MGSLPTQAGCGTLSPPLSLHMLVVATSLTARPHFVLQAEAGGRTRGSQHHLAKPTAGTAGTFDPRRAQSEKRREPAWVDFRGKAFRDPAYNHRSAETVAAGQETADIAAVPFRDPNHFVSGQLHRFYTEWDKILPVNDIGQKARGWILEGVDVSCFFREFKGSFKGKEYDSRAPPPLFQPNAKNCENYENFVSSTLEEWVRAGAIKVVGKVGEVEPPWLVMPLTVEPTKPRLCHDERFLNLWIEDCPFTLDTLVDVPRIVNKQSYMTSIDHKSGYQHVKITQPSQKYFGICWQGYFFTYCTLPFGFKGSCFVYHTLTSLVASYARELGVPNLAYIDDSLNAEFSQVTCTQGQAEAIYGGDPQAASKAAYIMCDLWCRLGYTLSLDKSVLIPTQVLKFLGMWVNSVLGAFVLPDDKKAAFAELREAILSSRFMSLNTLQRLQGKCISFTLAVPGARLYVSEMNSVIGKACKNSRHIQVQGALREEIEHWRFVDTWGGCSPWRGEHHVQIRIATDASTFKWGAMLLDTGGGMGVEMADFWGAGDDRPIHIKEAEALRLALMSVKDRILNSRVDAYVDNMALMHAWGRQGCRDIHLSRVMKEIFTVVRDQNVDLNLHYVRSSDNPADAPSRRLQWSDAMLAPETWAKVDRRFGPHSVDLMASDRNAMRRDGVTLKHYTPCPTPDSAGVNVFAQDLSEDIKPYCYPPICLLAPLLCYLGAAGAKRCTLVIPDLVPRPVWWPLLTSMSADRVVIGRKGQKGVILVPTKRGYVPDEFGLKWDLMACDVVFRRFASN